MLGISTRSSDLITHTPTSAYCELMKLLNDRRNIDHNVIPRNIAEALIPRMRGDETALLMLDASNSTKLILVLDGHKHIEYVYIDTLSPNPRVARNGLRDLKLSAPIEVPIVKDTSKTIFEKIYDKLPESIKGVFEKLKACRELISIWKETFFRLSGMN